MGRNLRSETMNPEVSGVYHCFNQFAQQSFLAGIDPVTGHDYSFRRTWLQRELAGLAGEFAIDILLYALMANHYHLLLRNRPDLVAEWDDFEVLMRWERIVNRVWRPDDSGQIPGLDWTPNWNQMQRALHDEAHLKTLRLRLSDPSWMIRLWCQSFSRYANKQTGHRGACYQGRFDSVPLVDDAALLACAMYIDLNPIRAGAASMPESAEFSSAHDRILGRAARSHRATASGLILPDADRLPVELAYADADDPDHWLAPLANPSGAKLAAILRDWFPEADTIEWASFGTDAEVVASLRAFLEQRSAAQASGEALESGLSPEAAFTVATPAATPWVASADALAAAEDCDSLAGTANTGRVEVTLAIGNRNAETALECVTQVPAGTTASASIEADVEVAVSLDANATVPSASAVSRRNWLEFSTASQSLAECRSAAASSFVAPSETMENVSSGPPSEPRPSYWASNSPPLVSLTGSTDAWTSRALGLAAGSLVSRSEGLECEPRVATRVPEARVRSRLIEKPRCSHARPICVIPGRLAWCAVRAAPWRRRSVEVLFLERPVFRVAGVKSRADAPAESAHVEARSRLALNSLPRPGEPLDGIQFPAHGSIEGEVGDASWRTTRESPVDDARTGGAARIWCVAGTVVIGPPPGRRSRPIPEQHLERWKNFQSARARPRPRAACDGLLDMTIDEYLEALDWAGRLLRRGKFGAIPSGAPPILERLECVTHGSLPPAPEGVLESVSEATATLVSPKARTENSLEAGDASQGDPSQEPPTTAEEWPADAPAVLRTSGIRASAFVDLLTRFSALFRTVAGSAGSVERFLAKLGRRSGKSVANGAAAFD